MTPKILAVSSKGEVGKEKPLINLTLQPVRCIRCGFEDPSNLYCVRCGLVLEEKLEKGVKFIEAL